MSKNEWKFAVKSVEDFKKRGLCSYYCILIGGKDSYTGKTEADCIRDGYAVLTEQEFNALYIEYQDSLCGKWYEITDKFFDDQLCVLPPIGWYDGGFFVGEATCGDVHAFYQRMDGKYYTSSQRLSTPRAAILAGLKEAIKNNAVEDRTAA